MIDSATASAAVKASRYYTTNWLALVDEGAVVVDERFLLRVEIALRSLAASGSVLATPCLRSDADVFAFVRGVTEGSTTHLARLRRVANGYGAPTQEGRREEDRRHELALVVLFFLAHEVGHLLDRNDARSFGSFVPPGAALEGRVANAGVKLARHVDEFERHRFGLPGFERVADAGDAIRAKVDEAARGLGVEPAEHDRFFADETSADRWASLIMEEHLTAVRGRDERAGDLALHLFCRGAFGAALYAWYADLLAFLEALGVDRLVDSRSLTFEMMADHENYVRAASLFGSVHRSTLLRATLAIESALRSQTDWFDEAEPAGAEFEAGVDAEAGVDPADLPRWWASESALRYFLLCHLMDTAVKLAYVGCSSAWWDDAARARGTEQLFMMTFESINAAVGRLHRR